MYPLHQSEPKIPVKFVYFRADPWQNVPHIESPIFFNTSAELDDGPSFIQFNSLELPGNKTKNTYHAGIIVDYVFLYKIVHFL